VDRDARRLVEEQFTDDPRGFPLDELDRIAPGNPVVLQAVYQPELSERRRA